MQPSRPNSAQPGRAPMRPRRLIGGPRLSATALSPAHSPSLARCPVGPTCRRQFLHLRALLSLCLAGPVRQLPSRCPACPLFFLCAVGLPCQLHPPLPRRGPVSAHSRMLPGFLATTPTHAPNSLLRAPPAPRTRPSPHFT
jgi:hypothetical protein